MLVKSLVISSYGFSLSFLLYFRNISKTINILSSMFPTSSYFTVLFSYHSLFSFLLILSNIEEPFTHMNQPVKLQSPPVLVDSTHFSLYAITEVSRKPKHTHFKS